MENRIVNVASVPQRSPFRYPGGKTWLIPTIRMWLESQSTRPGEFVEPFAGGGIVSLTIAFEDRADHVFMIELDCQVAAVWKTILGGDAEWLVERILNFTMTAENLDKALAEDAKDTKALAFQTILRNRTLRGGILAPGAGRVKLGESGKGILSRWYPETISKRILQIAQPHIRERITFVEGDGLEFAKQKSSSLSAVFFIDPPYSASRKRAGRRLYTHWEVDHSLLFRIANSFKGDFLMTYDNAEELHSLASLYDFDVELVTMKNTHHAKMDELLIGRDLKWAR